MFRASKRECALQGAATLYCLDDPDRERLLPERPAANTPTYEGSILNILGPASEAEMVGAFLQGEIDSPRFQDYILPNLDAAPRGRALIDQPDFNDGGENDYRASLLEAGRGYERRSLLFAGFPHDVVWSRALLAEPDFETVKYGKWAPWIQYSDGTRWTRRAAENFRQGKLRGETVQDIVGTLRRLAAGERLAPIIMVGKSLGATEFVLLEGHVRSTAFLLAGGSPMEALVGVSPDIPNWLPY